MDKMKEGFSRGARRVRENVNYSFGLSERKNELGNIMHLEQRNQKIVSALKSTKQNLQNVIRSGNKDDSLEKRKRRLDDSALAQQLQSDANEISNVFKNENNPPVLANVMKGIGEALDAIGTERVLTEQYIERNILDAFGKYVEEEKFVSKMKDKLAKAVVNVEVAKKRKQGVHDENKAQEIQDECDGLQLKVENYKDNIYTAVFNLYSKQAEIATLFKELVNSQMEYHRSALQRFENLLPDIDRKIASYPKRPVFGCHLEDHLSFSKRSIAVVLEVCCTTLKRKFFHERGLFRVNGNNNRIRRMKAAFDAHEIGGILSDAEENNIDPHSICSVLKLYLRELPEPLLTNRLRLEWGFKIEFLTFRLEPEARFQQISDLLPTLPEANRLNLAYLMRFLQLMLLNEREIMMSIGNISIVFGPNLINAEGSESENMLGAKLVETFLTYADKLFPNDKFDFDGPIRLLSTSSCGGFDENSPRLNSVTSNNDSTSNVGKGVSFRRNTALLQTPPSRARPKCPAPPPPAANANAANIQLLTTLPEIVSQNSRAEETSSSLENLPNTLCKSPLAASSGSLSDNGTCNIEITDELNIEGNCNNTFAPPGRPPPPRNLRQVSSPTDSSQLSNSCTPNPNSRKEHEVLVPPPRKIVSKSILSTDENNRTVVHLENDTVQQQPSVTTSLNNTSAGTGPIPKPRIPAKPKTVPPSNETTKL
uniref:Rho-GAP domain-containing protein n=1 Tax=Syphacia muris TaxID=451379 RepID=A0A158R544_9BILA